MIPQITGELVRKPVQSLKLRELAQKYTLADTIVRKPESSKIDLLIGNDYYLDFVTGEKIEVQRGLYLLGSEFGFILSGRTQKKRSNGLTFSM